MKLCWFLMCFHLVIYCFLFPRDLLPIANGSICETERNQEQNASQKSIPFNGIVFYLLLVYSFDENVCSNVRWWKNLDI